MSEVTKIEPLEDGGWLEHYTSGKIQAKDSSGKMIKHPRNVMPSKTAKELGQLGAQKAQDTSGEISDLLAYLSLASPFDYQMAKLVTAGKQNAVAASKVLMEAAIIRGSFTSEHKQFDLKPSHLYMAIHKGDAIELQEVEFNHYGIEKFTDYINIVREEQRKD